MQQKTLETKHDGLLDQGVTFKTVYMAHRKTLKAVTKQKWQVYYGSKPCPKKDTIPLTDFSVFYFKNQNRYY